MAEQFRGAGLAQPGGVRAGGARRARRGAARRAIIAPLDELDDALAAADIVIAALAQRARTLLTRGAVAAALQRRPLAPDLRDRCRLSAPMPSPAINDLDGVFLYDLGDLETRGAGRARRHAKPQRPRRGASSTRNWPPSRARARGAARGAGGGGAAPPFRAAARRGDGRARPRRRGGDAASRSTACCTTPSEVLRDLAGATRRSRRCRGSAAPAVPARPTRRRRVSVTAGLDATARQARARATPSLRDALADPAGAAAISPSCRRNTAT